MSCSEIYNADQGCVAGGVGVRPMGGGRSLVFFAEMTSATSSFMDDILELKAFFVRTKKKFQPQKNPHLPRETGFTKEWLPD